MRMAQYTRHESGLPPSPDGRPASARQAGLETLRLIAATALGLLVAAPLTFGQTGNVVAKPGPLAHTFSIVARDPATGELGVAVQSHWFSVGSIVTWAEAGVGAVATQSFVDPSYGYKGLELMRSGDGRAGRAKRCSPPTRSAKYGRSP